jgi:hypothetical protein
MFLKKMFRELFDAYFGKGIRFYQSLWYKITGNKPEPPIKISTPTPEKKKPKDVIIHFDEVYSFATDTATLAIFDPEVISHRLNAEIDWLAEASYHEMPEVHAGDIGLMGLGADGGYDIKPFLNQLPADLQSADHKKVTLGVKIVSGHCFIGNGESLSADGNGTTPESIREHDGGFLTLDNGLYDVDIYMIDDVLVLVFKVRNGEFIAPTSEPHLDDIS